MDDRDAGRGRPLARAVGVDALQPLRSAPASFLQEQLWLIEQEDGDHALYNEARALRLEGGGLDPGELARALSAVVARHETLRTTFRLDGGRIRQDVWPPSPVPLRFHDASALELDARERFVEDVCREVAEAPYDLTSGPLLRAALVRLGPAEQMLVLGTHHIVSDGESMDRVLREAGAVLAGEEPPAPGAQYAEFAAWQREALAAGTLEPEREFWTGMLAGAPTVLELPAERLRPRRRAGRGRREAFPLDAAALAGAETLAGELGCTTFAVLLAAFAALLHRCTGRDDVVVGTGLRGRFERFDATVGYFANTGPLRLRPAGSLTAAELVEQTAELLFDALDNQLLPFEKIVEAVQPARDPSVTPLVQVVFTPWEAGPSETSFGGLRSTQLEIQRGRARFDLACEVVTRDGEASLFVEYDSELYEADTVAELMRRYGALLGAILADPESPLDALPLLSEAEARLLPDDGLAVLDAAGGPLPPGFFGALHRDDGGGLRPTGLLARREPDGTVTELGRAERRVAIGDFEVQLEQVEAVLRRSPSVFDAAVVPRDGALVAFVVLADAEADGAALLRAVSSELPHYAVPAAAIPVAAIPQVDGFVEEQLLVTARPPAPEDAAHPRLEAALAVIWREELELDSVERDDDFFELGGHSMLAARIAQRVSDSLGVELRLTTVFEHCSVAELAGALERANPGLDASLAVEHAAAAAPAEDRAAAAPPAEMPLSSAQLQIWISEQLLGGDAKDFVAAVAYRISGPLDAAALDAALNAVVARHEALRTSVVLDGDEPVARIAPSLRVPLPVVELAAHEAEHAVLAEAQRPFDVAAGPLVRGLLLRTGPLDHTLVLVQHHLVTDAVSMAVLTRELEECYAALVERNEPALPPPPVPYSSYVAWERAWLDGPEATALEAFWRTRLADAAPLELRSGRIAERRTAYATETCRVLLAGEDAERATQLARACRATPFMLVTSAYAAVLGAWSGQDDVVIGTTVENRQLGGLEQTIGCCVNLVPLRIDVGGDPTFRELVERGCRAVLEAAEHQALPFQRVVRALELQPSLERTPLFQVTSDWIDDDAISLALPGCAVEVEPVAQKTLRFELALYAASTPKGLRLDLEYGLDLWDPQVVADRLERVAALIAAGARDPDRTLRELDVLAAAALVS